MTGSFHARVMNTPCVAMPELPLCGGSQRTREELAYKIGHRDARHAAAEIASEADSLREAAQGLRVALARLATIAERVAGFTTDEIDGVDDFELSSACGQARSSLAAYAKAAGESA